MLLGGALFFVLLVAAAALGNFKQKGYTEVDGLAIEIVQKGQSGVAVREGDYVGINYEAKLQDGTVVSYMRSPEAPYGFTVGKGEVLKGWDLGVVGMKVGETRRLTVSPELAFGSEGKGNVPANATVIFDIKLLSIN